MIDAVALLRQSHTRADQGDVAGAIALACEAMAGAEQDSALEEEIVVWLDALEERKGHPAAAAVQRELAQSPDDASACGTGSADVAASGGDAQTLSPARGDDHIAADGDIGSGPVGCARPRAAAADADADPAASSSEPEASGQGAIASSAASHKAPLKLEDAELLEAVRVYRAERAAADQEFVVASPSGAPAEKPGRQGSDDRFDFEQGEQADESDEGSAVERLLKSSFTMVGAVALMLVVVGVTGWWLFFSGPEIRPTARTSTEQSGWPDLKYKERRRGLVSPDEASMALQRAYATARREASDEASAGFRPGRPANNDASEAPGSSLTAREPPAPGQNPSLGVSVVSERSQPVAKVSGATGGSPARAAASTGRPAARARAGAVVKRQEAVRPAPPQGGRWFFGTGAAEGPKDSKSKAQAPTKAKRAPIPIASQIEAQLEMGVSSLSHGQVMARTTGPVAAGRFTLPKGALLLGSSSHRGARVFLAFTQVIVGDRTWSLAGEAVAADKMKGLPAHRRAVTLEERQQAELARGALDALRRGVVTRSGTVGQLVDDVAGAAVEEAREEQRVDASVVYEVAAGEQFTVVVTE